MFVCLNRQIGLVNKFNFIILRRADRTWLYHRVLGWLRRNRIIIIDSYPENSIAVHVLSILCRYQWMCFKSLPQPRHLFGLTGSVQLHVYNWIHGRYLWQRYGHNACPGYSCWYCFTCTSLHNTGKWWVTLHSLPIATHIELCILAYVAWVWASHCVLLPGTSFLNMHTGVLNLHEPTRIGDLCFSV